MLRQREPLLARARTLRARTSLRKVLRTADGTAPHLDERTLPRWADRNGARSRSLLAPVVCAACVSTAALGGAQHGAGARARKEGCVA
jgi:hypothetical protein